MRFNRLLAPAVIAAAPLGACVSGSVQDFAGSSQTLVLEEYFLGETVAYGLFEDRFGKVRRQFKVDITGTFEDGVLTLDEQFLYDDGERDVRVWEITPQGGGKYQGRAGDVVGVANGEIAGNTLNWKYKVDLKVGDDTWRVTFDDWMYLQPDGVLLNRAYVSRFGVEIGQVTISFNKPGT